MEAAEGIQEEEGQGLEAEGVGSPKSGVVCVACEVVRQTKATKSIRRACVRNSVRRVAANDAALVELHWEELEKLGGVHDEEMGALAAKLPGNTSLQLLNFMQKDLEKLLENLNEKA